MRNTIESRAVSAISVVVWSGIVCVSVGCGTTDGGATPSSDAATGLTSETGMNDSGTHVTGMDAAANNGADGAASESGGDEAASPVFPGADGGVGLGNDSGPIDSGTASSSSDSGGIPVEGGPDDSAANVSTTFFARYEAESSANTLTDPGERPSTEGDRPCAGMPGTNSDGVKEGANCASAGLSVTQLLGRSPCTPPNSNTGCKNTGAGIIFNGVTVPATATYDVTFWYHAGVLTGHPGVADVFGDVHCGGLNYNTGPGSGCRPHVILVNGVQMTATVAGQNAVYYQFPCYPSAWSIVHGAVVALPLKAGANTIFIKAPPFATGDGADIDALDVQPAGAGAPAFQANGQGAPPTLPIGLVTPVVNWN
ncbi:MAG: hypothetical protein M3O46_07495 [Myxococcota bacterium]|nr:hypothetical protein [Myxococcota bacterium]